MIPFRVLLITDEAACARASRGVVETVARALGDDARDVAVLVRMKHAREADVAAACTAVRAIARRAGALTLVHTHAQLVARLGLDGAHIGDGARVDEARIAMPPGALLGASRHASPASDSALDYVTLSPIFSPTSKPDDARPTLGLRALRRGRTPIVALGGVDETNARACIAAGAHAVAVMGAVMAARDPRAVVRALLR